MYWRPCGWDYENLSSCITPKLKNPGSPFSPTIYEWQVWESLKEVAKGVAPTRKEALRCVFRTYRKIKRNGPQKGGQS